jgi:hypothetical protein
VAWQARSSPVSSGSPRATFPAAVGGAAILVPGKVVAPGQTAAAVDVPTDRISRC